MEKVKIINGVKVTDITPTLSPEKDKERINKLAEGLLRFRDKLKKNIAD